MPEFIETRTERLLLRPIDIEGDAEDILEWYKLESTMRYMAALPKTTLEEVRAFLTLRSASKTSLNCAVVLPLPNKESGKKIYRVIGVMGCRAWPELGYTFHPDFHGRGYATEALRAFMSELWRQMPMSLRAAGDLETGARFDIEDVTQGYDYAIAVCDTENLSSIRMLERV